MKKKILVVMLVMGLLSALGGSAVADVLGYNLDRAEHGFKDRPDAEPSSTAVIFDGLIGRPLGLATTVAGTGLFVVTLPFSIPSGSVEQSARGMIARPGGWTFVRPMGKGDKRFEEKGVFGVR